MNMKSEKCCKHESDFIPSETGNLQPG